MQLVFFPLSLNLFFFEYRNSLSTGATEKIQLSSLLGSFRIAVEITLKSRVAWDWTRADRLCQLARNCQEFSTSCSRLYFSCSNYARIWNWSCWFEPSHLLVYLHERSGMASEDHSNSLFDNSIYHRPSYSKKVKYIIPIFFLQVQLGSTKNYIYRMRATTGRQRGGGSFERLAQPTCHEDVEKSDGRFWPRVSCLSGWGHFPLTPIEWPI